ncbi:hypothetical protein ACIBQ1_23210 [Nonomuraea sp. NPDC050153]|uniref:hypothetical protein n=1 Tax=Nonomuraea sp. NPDC050153 TaxID=3364359 RepID=UPI0037931F97
MRPIRPRRLLPVLAALALITGGGTLVIGPARAEVIDLLPDPEEPAWYEDLYDEYGDDEPTTDENATDENATDEGVAEGDVAEGDAADEDTQRPSPGPTPLQPPPPPDPATANTEFHLAVNTALDRLERYPRCNSFVTGLDSPGGEDALSILRAIWKAPRLFDMYSKHGTPAPDGRLPYAEATQGRGSAGTIRLYQEWHQSKPQPVQYNNDDGGKPLDPNEWRTLILLHEVGHLTGAMASHRTEAGNTKNTYTMNEGILLTCLRGKGRG